MPTFVTRCVRDAAGSPDAFSAPTVLALLAALVAISLFVSVAATPLEAATSGDLPTPELLSADEPGTNDAEDFSSDVDVPDFYSGVDGDVFAMFDDVFASPDREPDPADAVGDIEPFPAEQEALRKAQSDPSRLNVMTLAMVRARMATVLLAKARTSPDLVPAKSGMDRAIAYALSAVDLVPDEPAFTFLLAQVYAAQPKSDLMISLAEDAAERTLALDPAKAEARLLLGAILFRQRFFGPALDSFERAVTDRPALLDIRTSGLMGSAYCLDGQAERGERFFDAFAKKDPQCGPAWFALSVLRRANGKNVEAKSSMEKAISALKSDPATRKYAGTLLKEWGGNAQ